MNDNGNLRNYFEAGCYCIHIEGSVELQGPEVPDEVATEYYINNCTCTRNDGSFKL